jgi:DNA-binding PadR family transcriptional regulator
MVLGMLAQHGPQHGHQIRRLAQLTNVGEWGGVSVGAMYRELRVMEHEGLVEAIRTEKVGRRPERTVYEITGEGHLELVTLREQAIRPIHPGSDPIGVALSFAAGGADREELRATLRTRRSMLAIAITQMGGDLERLLAKGYLEPLPAAIMRREVMRMETEIAWHDEVDAMLAAGAALVPDSWRSLGAHAGMPDTSGPGGAGEQGPGVTGVRGNAHDDY